jgi:hypothetical protein
MSHTFTQLLYHIVFGTQNRENLIDPELRDVLYPFMAASSGRSDAPYWTLEACRTTCISWSA